VGTGLVALACASAAAGKLCVSPSGKGGCLSTIGAAVKAAAPNDTIRVLKGTYRESVIIDKPLALLGDGS